MMSKEILSKSGVRKSSYLRGHIYENSMKTQFDHFIFP
jgi:hypothetical protein